MSKWTLFYVYYRKDPGSMFDTSLIYKERVARSMEDALNSFRDQYKDLRPVTVDTIFYMGEW